MQLQRKATEIRVSKNLQHITRGNGYHFHWFQGINRLLPQIPPFCHELMGKLYRPVNSHRQTTMSSAYPSSKNY